MKVKENVRAIIDYSFPDASEEMKEKTLSVIVTENVAEVVRCKDCRYFTGETCINAKGLAHLDSEDCYCNYGV